jgi:hypothetical protein
VEFYSVFYRQPGKRIWKTLKNVKGDGTLQGANGQILPARFFILSDETRVELPVTLEIRFSPERAVLIEKNMERETGQRIDAVKGKIKK